MAIKIIKEVSRDEGRLPATGASILGGSPLELNASNEVLLYTGGSNYPWGLAADSNVTQPLQGAGGLTVGAGFDYTNFNRGGLISVFMNGGVFELYNDGTGNPFATAPVAAYAVNEAVYATGAGIVSTDATEAPEGFLGTVVAISNAGSATAMRLQIRLMV